MICPNCGRNVAQNAEICPFCNAPTQFSSRMKYYPRSTPLDAKASLHTNETKPIHTQQSTQAHGDLKEVLVRLSDLPKKKEVRSNSVRTLLAVCIAGILCIAIILGSVVYLSNRIQSIQSYTDSSLSRIENRVNGLASAVSKVQSGANGDIERDQTQTESSLGAIQADSILVTLYCNYREGMEGSPVCFVVKKGTDITLPTLSSAAHVFLGWKEKDSEKLIPPGETYRCDEEGTIELFACWKALATSSPEPSPTPSPGRSDARNSSQPDLPSGTPDAPTSEPTAESLENDGNPTNIQG